jgi:2-C-methyl-D-erythritol 2,4-cyclodiphosphate synthase
MITRVGIGYDVHAFAHDRALVLGGITIPFDCGLLGDTDADALIHAVVDALLGAAVLGDLGARFPNNDGRWNGQTSTLFLDHTSTLLHQYGWQIGNIDATIVAQRPILAPYIGNMRMHVATHLHIDLEQMSIKATTTDGLGFAGRQEGIACYAIAMLTKG